jgi:hypothetical protein
MRMRMPSLLVLLLVAALPAQADKDRPKKLAITPAAQQQLDAWRATAIAWAADKVVVAAVLEQNRKGPLEGMDNKKWKTLRRRSAEIEAFTTNAAAKVLAANAAASGGRISEVFVSAQKGEKVAFLAKTSSYLHAGTAKFDVPFHKLQAWQGEPEFDESSQTYAVQVAVPVLDPADPKKAIGVLVIGLDLTRITATPPGPAK